MELNYLWCFFLVICLGSLESESDKYSPSVSISILVTVSLAHDKSYAKEVCYFWTMKNYLKYQVHAYNNNIWHFVLHFPPNLKNMYWVAEFNTTLSLILIKVKNLKMNLDCVTQCWLKYSLQQLNIYFTCGSSLAIVWLCVGGADAGRAGGDHPRSVPRVDKPKRRGTTAQEQYI